MRVCVYVATHIQILQAVPAEGVLAALAEHLCTALVPLDVNATHGALLDGRLRVAAENEAASGTQRTVIVIINQLTG